ncbi:Carboxypeptidase KEX1 [Verticillium dahliae VDG1]|nr:Carboxypeptidase KEX1 [Verticillium dahliae VDG1]
MDSGEEDLDLYGLLGVDKTATPDQIKKAYRKAALQHHPDKVSEDIREESEAKFKSVTQAYEILRDEEKRHMYDTHGMAAFDGRGGPGGPEVDLNDILSQMFGFGMGGPGGPGGPGGGPQRPRRGPDEEQEYRVSLEELYKGKTVKFSADKQIVCGTCKGSGAKPSVKPTKCEKCQGAGMSEAFQQIGPGMGHDLSAELNITLGEALGGFSRVVLTHLDGRGIHIDRPRGKIIRPGDVLKVPGEGMPMKKGELKGDLYLIANVEFPENDWLKDDKEHEALAKLLPPAPEPIKAKEVDDVDYESDADLAEMGARHGGGGGGQWEDVDEDEGQPQCQQQ